jgi:hypothetical protein
MKSSCVLQNWKLAETVVRTRHPKYHPLQMPESQLIDLLYTPSDLERLHMKGLPGELLKYSLGIHAVLGLLARISRLIYRTWDWIATTALRQRLTLK